jgi:hypothetical protein
MDREPKICCSHVAVSISCEYIVRQVFMKIPSQHVKISIPACICRDMEVLESGNNRDAFTDLGGAGDAFTYTESDNPLSNCLSAFILPTFLHFALYSTPTSV